MIKSYRLVKTNEGYELLIYLDPQSEEFASEFGESSDVKEHPSIKKYIQKLVKSNFASVNIVTAKVMVGATLLTTIPVDDVKVSATEFSQETIPQDIGQLPIKDAENHWAHDEIMYNLQKGWFKGKTDTMFAPEQSMTRAEAAQVLVRVLNLKPIEPLNQTFPDINRDYWAFESIEIARQHGIFSGKSNGQFGATDPLTREQMAIVLDNIFKNTYDQNKKNQAVFFKDVSPRSVAYNSIVSLKQQQIFEGFSDQTFRPQQSITRGQAAVILTRLNDRISTVKGETVSQPTLRVGSRGADVTLLQINLKNLGLFNHKATGYFGSTTEKAVRDFQSNHGLTIDGVVGSKAHQKVREKLNTKQAQVAEQAPKIESYTVQSGDTLSKIANRFNLTVDEIKRYNNLTSDTIFVGQRLSLTENSNAASITYTNYTVKQGDTIWDISVKFGVPQAEVLKSNNLTERSMLYIGQSLKIPVHHVPVQQRVSERHGEYLDWWTEAQYVFPIGATAKVTDFQTGKSFTIKRTIGANHADVEPLTAQDTAIMNEVWGGYSWKERAVIVEVNGRKIAASMSNMPHDVQYITNNNYHGHTDIHFKNSTRHKDGLINHEHQRQIKIAAGIY